LNVSPVKGPSRPSQHADTAGSKLRLKMNVRSYASAGMIEEPFGDA